MLLFVGFLFPAATLHLKADKTSRREKSTFNFGELLPELVLQEEMSALQLIIVSDGHQLKNFICSFFCSLFWFTITNNLFVHLACDLLAGSKDSHLEF